MPACIHVTRFKNYIIQRCIALTVDQVALSSISTHMYTFTYTVHKVNLNEMNIQLLVKV